MGSKPARVAAMRVTVNLPEGVPADKRQALLAVAAHCTVHNTLTLTPAPEVIVQLDRSVGGSPPQGPAASPSEPDGDAQARIAAPEPGVDLRVARVTAVPMRRLIASRGGNTVL